MSAHDRLESALRIPWITHYGAARLEAAAERALDIGARTYGSVKSILDNNLDRRPAPKRATDAKPIQHPNIRGPRYYN
jgi:transposase